MPIVASDIQLRLSAPGASAGDTTTGTVGASRGRYVSTTQVNTGANTVFADVTAAQNVASVTDYACVFVLNNHATLTLNAAGVYLSAQIAGGAVCAVGVDPTPASDRASGVAQAVLIATTTSPPAGVTFSESATSTGTALPLGNIGPGQVRAVWIRRAAVNSTALPTDGATLAVTGTTLD